MQTYKKILTFFFVVILGVVSGQSAFALEVNYPTLTLFQQQYRIGSGTDIADYITYFFVFLILAAGFIAVVSVAISGVKILFAAGNPTVISDAKSRMLGAALGIVLLFASFIILRTINSNLVTSNAGTPSGLTDGSVWYRGCRTAVAPGEPCPSWKYVQAAESERDTNRNIPAEFTEIYYYCDAPIEGPQLDHKKLLVWVYNQTDFKIDWGLNGPIFAETVELDCYGSQSLRSGVKSFSRAYQDAGIYFYTKYANGNCAGVSTYLQNKSANIPPFDDRAVFSAYPPGCMKIVTGTDSRTLYGAILSRNYNLGGECTYPFYNLVPNSAKSFDLSPDRKWKYARVVNFDRNVDARPDDSIKFYSKDFMAEIKQGSNIPGLNPIWGATISHPLNDPFNPIPNAVMPTSIGNLLIIASGTNAGLPPPDPGAPALHNTNPDRIVRPVAFGGRGVRWTIPYSDATEESYAKDSGTGEGVGPNADPRGKGSAWFEGNSSVLFGSNFFGRTFSGNPGNFQCNDKDRECIRSIENNGLYYVVLYARNVRLDDKGCFIASGRARNSRTDFGGVLDRDKYLYAIAIIPTTP